MEHESSPDEKWPFLCDVNSFFLFLKWNMWVLKKNNISPRGSFCAPKTNHFFWTYMINIITQERNDISAWTVIKDLVRNGTWKFTRWIVNISLQCELISLFFKQNIGCRYSKEPSQWDGSFEHQKKPNV